MSQESVFDPQELNPYPAGTDPVPMHTLARMEATDALKAIKLGQYNGNDGLAKARNTIGNLAAFVFNLVIDNIELRDASVRRDMVADAKNGGKPLTLAQKKKAEADSKITADGE